MSAVCGHSYQNVFTYVEHGENHEVTVPGGAMLLHDWLNDAAVASAADDWRREYSELVAWPGKPGRYTMARHLGHRPGRTMSNEEPDALTVVWDEGWGGIAVPGGDDAVLWASRKALPAPEVLAQIASRCLLFLDVELLRGAGAMISRQISWERSVTELLWQLRSNQDIAYLLGARDLLIAFAEDAVVHISHDATDIRASIVLGRGDGEGSARLGVPGSIDDAFLVMTASLAQQIEGGQSWRITPLLRAAESLLTTGYSADGLISPTVLSAADGEDDIAFDIPMPPMGSDSDPQSWCISQGLPGQRLFDTAVGYVMNGAVAISHLPKLTLGALTAVDRWEIESFQVIRNLIVDYSNSRGARPLSIAVFGSPGSGKSFGVTQIATNVMPGRVEKLEFNVSQFIGQGDLAAAFNRVRDVVVRGKVPLVFFDEFDSDRDGRALGWLKSFLMPMQDGKFKDESGEHPLGKSILVFAGGTSSSFEEFTKPMISEKPEEQKKFKDVKGPDFVSRLRGTINVLGPNQTSAEDKNYILRRALLLRSLCERKLKTKKGEDTPISKNVLWAMLLVPKYKHGARSMEAILDMSRIEGNAWEPVSLPFYSQLSLHVDADAFIKLVLREVILNSYIEKLAMEIHTDFRKKNPGADNDKPWEELTEHFKDSNRNQARDIGAKLKLIGCEYDSGDTPFPSIEQFDKETVLFLAKNEHQRWMDEKTKNGWVYAPVRDNEKKHNPLLVEWDKLPVNEQKKDVDAVENIIPLLKGIGLRVYRTI